MKFINIRKTDGKICFKSYRDFILWLIFLPIMYVSFIFTCLAMIPIAAVNSVISAMIERIMGKVGITGIKSALVSMIDISVCLSSTLYDVLIKRGVKIDKTIGDDK